MTEAFVAEEGAQEDEEKAGKIGGLAGEFAEALEVLFGVANAEGGDGSGKDHGGGEAEAETNHQGEAEGEFFQLQADEQNRERGRAGHEAAGEAEEDDLRGGDGTVGKAAFDVGGVGAFVGVLKFGVGGGGVVVWVVVRMVMFVFVMRMRMFVIVGMVFVVVVAVIVVGFGEVKREVVGVVVVGDF